MSAGQQIRKRGNYFAFSLTAFVADVALLLLPASAQELAADKVNLDRYQVSKLNVGPHDWPQWCGTSLRNNVPVGTNIPTNWNVEKSENIRWSAELGSQSRVAPVVANGKVFVGTNNMRGYVPRYSADVDLGCLICFDEKDGRFLWQHSNEKLPSGLVNDWPYQGILDTPVVDGDRLWYVTNRGEVVCLDTEGYYDKEDDGLRRSPEEVSDNEADIVWKFDMMAELGVRQHNWSNCSPTVADGRLFVITSNGLDETFSNFPAPDAPAFAVFDCKTGKLLWTDNSSGKNVLNGSWSSPAAAVLGGRPQVLFPAGDGWRYSFDPAGDGHGGSKLLWKFDGNPKQSKYFYGGRGTRNEQPTMPVIYDNRVYFAMAQDAENGEGPGILWCIDPTKKMDGSDVSPTLAFDAAGKRLPPRRLQAVNAAAGEVEKPNPDSAVVWQFEKFDLDGNGMIEYEEEMKRTIGPVAIKDQLLFVVDFSGIVRCLDARTGKMHWDHDLLSGVWAPPLIVDGKVYCADEDGEVTIFEFSTRKRVINEIDMGSSVYATLIVANNVLYITSKSKLYAISN